MAIYMAGKTIPSETPPVMKKDMADQQTVSKGMNTEGLDKFMNQPDGSFAIPHSGGAPIVANGPSQPQNALLGPTNLHTGSGLKPAKLLGSLYVAPDSVT